MPVRFLSDAQRAELAGFPRDVDDEVLDRFFTLNSDDLEAIRAQRGDSNRLGWALQLCGLRMLGFCPDDLTSTPPVAVRFVARQVEVDASGLDRYGRRAQTRTAHAAQVRRHLDFRTATADDLSAAGEWLAGQALEQDRPIVLFQLVCSRLYEMKIERPGLTIIEQSLVGSAREVARKETARLVEPLLTPERRQTFDELLEVDPDFGIARATWLRLRPVNATPAGICEELDKLEFLRCLGVDQSWDLTVLPARKVRSLAKWAQSASNQALTQSSDDRRLPAMLAFVSESHVAVTDGLIELFDKLLADMNAKARLRLADYRESIATAANDKVLLLAQIAEVLLDPSIDDEQKATAVFDAVPRDRLATALVECHEIARPPGGSHVDLLAPQYARLRRCSPRFLDLLDFRAERDPDGLLEAIEVLRRLNKKGARKVPLDAPTGFISKQWMAMVRSESEQISRRFWEMAVLWTLRNRLRSGDVWVHDSRRYANPETYLISPQDWPKTRTEFSAAVNRPETGSQRLTNISHELDGQIESFSDMLETSDGPVRIEDDRLVVGRDAGDEVPESVKQLRSLLSSVLPRVELTDLIIAMDAACGFSQHLTHSGGASRRTPEMLAHLYAAIVAQATNLGPTAMARASDLSYDQIAHASAWYLRDETLTAAIDAVINYHHQLPAAKQWGDGTFSSSDGQRFPVAVKAANSGALPRYFGFGKGISVLTSVSDHYATFGTKVIPAGAREGIYALDEIFALRDRDTSLEIDEHTTDTAGFTDLLFGVYDLVGLKFSPRIRNVADQRLWHLNPTAFADTPLSGHRANQTLIEEHWDDLLRVGASIHSGTVLPSLLLSKLQSFPRQNALARALQEYGRLVKTLFILKYLQQPEQRKRSGRQLNKGEALHAVRTTVNFARQGRVRHRHITEQTTQALCISLVVNCIAAYNARLLPPAINTLKTQGHTINDDDVAYLGPTMTEHLNVHGRYRFDLTNVGF